MKLVRPYIPVKVRCEVIARQLMMRGKTGLVLQAITSFPKDSARLEFMLRTMFGDQPCHLDHEPPLCLRHVIDAAKGIYDPPANSAESLIYRTAEEHRVKTFIRGDGAQLSDAGKRRKEIRRNRAKRPSRWPPKGSRPMRSKRDAMATVSPTRLAHEGEPDR